MEVIKMDTIKNYRVLLLEDNRLIQRITKHLLQELNCSVEIANDGLEALSLSKNYYDLLLIDLDLPDINGLTVAKAIRSEELLGRSKRENILIALTADNEHLRDLCMNAGMDDFYTKPVTTLILKEILEKWCGKQNTKNQTGIK